MLVRILITDAGGAAFHRSGYSPKRLFTEAAIHRTLLQVEHSSNILFTEKAAIPLWDCSLNVLQFNRAHIEHSKTGLRSSLSPLEAEIQTFKDLQFLASLCQKPPERWLPPWPYSFPLLSGASLDCLGPPKRKCHKNMNFFKKRNDQLEHLPNQGLQFSSISATNGARIATSTTITKRTMQEVQPPIQHQPIVKLPAYPYIHPNHNLNLHWHWSR